jgi:hypothetical protein
MTKVAYNLGRRYWDSEDQPRGLILVCTTQGGPHCTSGGNAVIHNDHHTTGYANGRVVAAIGFTAPVYLCELPPHFGTNIIGTGPKLPDDIFIQHKLRARPVNDGPDAELGISRRTNLAHKQQV